MRKLLSTSSTTSLIIPSSSNSGTAVKTRISSPSNNTTSEQLYSSKQICELIGIHRVTLWRMCKNGEFPRPLKITVNKRGWKKSDYEHWLAKQVEQRNENIKQMDALNT